jgi:pimeloyl-ACP methyl ester carboxylesterase
MATALACAQWPVEPVTVDQPHAEGSKPILVVGTTDDPVTSYATAVRMARQLDRGVLLTYRGGGHTAFGGRNGCVDLRVTAYLIDLTVPEEGTTCR